MIEFQGHKYSTIEMFNINSISLSGGENKELDTIKKSFSLSDFNQRKINQSKANISVVVTGHSTTFFITDDYGVTDTILFSNKHQDSIDDAIYLAVKDKLLTSIDYLDENENFQPEQKGPISLNMWLLSQPKGRQKVLAEDKWMLAGSAFEAGMSIGQQNIVVKKDKVEIPFFIKEGSDNAEDNLADFTGKIIINNFGVGIAINGYSTSDDDNEVIYLEKYSGDPLLRVYSDISKESAVVNVNLRHAKTKK
jgi:hypothetical protein